MIGRTLGHYRIVEPLGAGGMGEVYRAHDERLDRDVALKVLPEGALSDEEARKRFRKEAKALSRLSHPHIATLHDFDGQDGTDFIVMELVSGPSLAEELKAGPLDEKRIVTLGAQLARGLQAAHQQGIVHRDLKPSNLQLTPDGLLKILDFGLARLVPKEPVAGDETAPTQTAVGTVAGTLAYMSPEQLRGRGVDARTDLYAAGAVLYEMATGRRLFSKPSAAELTAAILDEEPTPPRGLNSRISSGLESVILKAIDKDPNLRCQTANDLLVDLERLAAGTATVGTGRQWPGRRSAWIVAGVALLVGIGATLALLTRPGALRIASVRTLVAGPMGAVRGMETDGTHVYYAEDDLATDRLLMVPLGGGTPREITLPWRGESSLWVVDLRPTPLELLLCQNGELWRLPLPGGVPSPLAVSSGRCLAAWSPNGDRLAWVEGDPPADALLVGNADGEEPRLLVDAPRRAEERSGLQLLGWSPRGNRIRFAHADRPEAWFDVPATGGTPSVALATFPPGLLNEVSGRPEWTSDGFHFLCPSFSGLYAFAEAVGGRLSEPTLLQAPSPLRRMSATPDGRRLVGYVSRPGTTIVRLDPETKAVTPVLGGARARVARYSPDGTQIAWVSSDGGDERLWLSRPDGSERVQLSDLALDGYLPVQWSPDGGWIAFTAWEEAQGNRHRLYLATPGTGRVELLAPDDPSETQGDPCWSPDGEWLAYGPTPLAGFPSDGEFYLRRVDLATRTVAKLPGSDGLHSPKCAPDGRILAQDYFAWRAAPGGREAAVGPGLVFFKLWDPATGVWTPLSVEVPAAGGDWSGYPGGYLTYPTWSHDGRRVYAYLATTASVVRFDLQSRRLETVFSVAGLEGTDSSWMDLDPADVPLVHRDATHREIVVIEWDGR